MKYPVQYDHGASAYGKKSSVLTDHVSPASWRALRYIDGVEYIILTEPFCEETIDNQVLQVSAQAGLGMRLYLSNILHELVHVLEPHWCIHVVKI